MNECESSDSVTYMIAQHFRSSLTRTSERSGRAIDHDESGSMEKKKREGYF